MNHDRRPEPGIAPTAAHRTPDHEPLERCKRASLRSQAQQAAWQLGALVRRVEREAPEVHRRLRCAVEALQLLSAKLALEPAGQASARAAAVPGREAQAHAGPPPAAETGIEGEAEFF